MPNTIEVYDLSSCDLYLKKVEETILVLFISYFKKCHALSLQSRIYLNDAFSILGYSCLCLFFFSWSIILEFLYCILEENLEAMVEYEKGENICLFFLSDM